jgi:Fe/S biogenesis protein NfuA
MSDATATEASTEADGTPDERIEPPAGDGARKSPLSPPDATPEAEESPRAENEIVRVTEAARVQVLSLREDEDDEASGLGLRIEITGSAGKDFTYDLSFAPLAEQADDDVVHTSGGELPVIIPANSVDSLRGSTLDLPTSPLQEGLVLRNPNRPNPLSGQHLDLTGDVAERVTQLLDEQINPALASHGGYAKLEGIDGEKAFVTMGGGCQGCAVSAMTLRDGIQASILEAIPEITEVVDVTDHDAGETPYYE